jgi:hypothetical protein
MYSFLELLLWALALFLIGIGAFFIVAGLVGVMHHV